MNWRRGFLRLGIVAAIAALPLGAIAYDDWREQLSQQPQFVQLTGNAASTRALYEEFVHRAHQTASNEGLSVPDARVISRSAIPTAPNWLWRLALTFGSLGFVLGVGVSWVVAGFRKK